MSTYLIECYLCLKKENQVGEFLQYYPEHKKIFNDFKNKIYNYTNNLYVAYINCNRMCFGR